MQSDCHIISADFSNRDTQEVACALLGKIIQTTRLGILPDRDEHLPYRFVDAGYVCYCTRNPLWCGQVESRDYWQRPLTATRV